MIGLYEALVGSIYIFDMSIMFLIRCIAETVTDRFHIKSQ